MPCKHPVPGDIYRRPVKPNGKYFVIAPARGCGDYDDRWDDPRWATLAESNVATVLVRDWHPSNTTPRPREWPDTTVQCLVLICGQLATIIVEEGYWELVKSCP